MGRWGREKSGLIPALQRVRVLVEYLCWQNRQEMWEIRRHSFQCQFSDKILTFAAGSLCSEATWGSSPLCDSVTVAEQQLLFPG